MSAERLPAYGLAPGVGGELVSGDGRLRLRWGGSGGQYYLWVQSQRRLLVIDEARAKGLDGAIVPPIEKRPLSKIQPGPRIAVDGLLLSSENGWHAVSAPNRPPFDRRVRVLIGLLQQVELNDLAGVAVAGLPPVGSVVLDAPAPGVPALPGLGGTLVEAFAAGEATVVLIAGMPAQRVQALRSAELRSAFAAFRTDVLLDVRDLLPNHDIERVEVTRDGAAWWSLQRRPKPAKVGGYWWDVVWAGGREPAADQALSRLVEAVAAVPVRDPVPDGKALAALPPGAVAVAFVGEAQHPAVHRVAIAGGELRSASHRARLADDGSLAAALAPERSLDPRLIHRDASRVAKIQRRFRGADGAPDPGRDEVVSRSENGRWTRTWPSADKTPVDGAAVDRFVRALAAAVTSDLHPVAGDGRADGSRALRDGGQFELAVRFAPIADREASNDEADLDTAASQDWGIALRRDGDRWLGVDLDLGLRFTLDDDTVGELIRPFTGGQVFPVVASAADAVEITRPDGTVVRLARRGAGWTVATGAGPAVAADPLAVRRWFRVLGALTAADGALDGRVPEPSPADCSGRIVVTLPSVSWDPWNKTEQVTLAVLKPTDRGIPLHSWTNRGGSRFPRGRTVLPVAVAGDLLPDAAAFTR